MSFLSGKEEEHQKLVVENDDMYARRADNSQTLSSSDNAFSSQWDHSRLNYFLSRKLKNERLHS